ncbi:MAG: proton extrusion protein PcxA, partial [Nostoc sp. NMS9]|nr:proton extrusion protein PcxA [Nostoc sp. NMS9]
MNFNPLNLNQWNQWLNRRQLQVLEAAYKAAQNIKALEDKYFNGGKITY